MTASRKTAPLSRSIANFTSRRRSFYFQAAIICLLIAVVGCETSTDGQRGSPDKLSNQKIGKPTIFTVSLPLEWATAQIAGDFADVQCPAATTDTPDRWRPDRATLAKMQSADLLICNGTAAPYANWLQTSSLPSSKMVEAASKGLSLADFISVEDIQIVHSHGPEGEHSHPTMVSRTWLSPSVLSKQATYIEQQLSKRFPDQATAFGNNLATLTAKLDSLSKDFETPESAPAIKCLSATPELKFLTRFTRVEDRHFNWKQETTVEQAKTDFENRIREVSVTGQDAEKASAQPNAQKSAAVILFPARLNSLASKLDDALSAKGYQTISIDLLDQKIGDQDFLTRLRANLSAINKVREAAKSPVGE